MRRIAPAVALTLLAACQTPPAFQNVMGVEVISAEGAARCTPLQRVTTTTGVSGELGREQALRYARNATMAAVRDAGGNAVVFTAGGPDDPDALFVEAMGYRC